MRIGTIAQHSNTSPTGFNSVINDAIPGRLNDYLLTTWYDFTDFNAVGVDPAQVQELSNLTNMDDKGPYNKEADAGSFGVDLKGPSWFNASDNDPLGSQNFQSYAQGGISNDYLTTTLGEGFKLKAFTILLVFDPTPESNGGTTYDIGTATQTYFHYVGNTSSPNVQSLRFDVVHNLAGDYFQFVIINNAGVTITQGSPTDTGLQKFIGGDYKYNFNYVTIVGREDGSISIYLKGHKVAMKVGYPSEGVPTDAITKLFTRHTNTSLDYMSQTKIYEYMLFNEALTETELYDIDLYIRNKYHFKRGRLGGF